MTQTKTWAAFLLVVGLAQVGVAQSTTSPTTTDSSTQTKQDKKAAKEKAKTAKAPIKAETGKKTTTSQDAAYALASQKGVEKTSVPAPK
jgi:hypothetical protein